MKALAFGIFCGAVVSAVMVLTADTGSMTPNEFASFVKGVGVWLNLAIAGLAACIAYSRREE